MNQVQTAVAEVAAARDTKALVVISHVLTLTKRTDRALSNGSPDRQLEAIMDAALGSAMRKRGWSMGFEVTDPVMVPTEIFGTHFKATKEISSRFGVDGDKDNGYTYRVNLVATVAVERQRSTLDQELTNLCAAVYDAAPVKDRRWSLELVDGKAYTPHAQEMLTEEPGEEIGYAPAELPSMEVWDAAYKDVYGLEDILLQLRWALEAAWNSHFTQRINVVLIGPPACGKTQILRILKSLFTENAVLEFDVPSTTQAGAQDTLNKLPERPRIIILEEAEKASTENLQWMLSVLDMRGEVRKVTARGEFKTEIHAVGIATVNNRALFERVGSGALASRFAYPLDFNRPDDDILRKILHREIRQLRTVSGGKHGNVKWVDETLKLVNLYNERDPRRVIAWMLTGADHLLDGSFQKFLAKGRERSAKALADENREEVISKPLVPGGK